MSASWTRQPSELSTPHSPLSTLLMGDVDRSEFDGARAVLESWGRVETFSTTDDAAAVLQCGALAPDLIVAAQAFPGQIAHAAIARLRRLAPLARFVGLLGSWCEGEMRTGSPWPGVVRIYGHQWTARAGRELRRMVLGEPCAWSLPPTATEEERLLTDVDWTPAPTEPRDARGLMWICSPSREMAEWLAAMCQRRGYATVWRRDSAFQHVEDATAAIFDADRLDKASCAELKRLADAVRPSPVIALLAFPRAEDRRRAMQAGATAIVSKPFAIEDFWEVESKRPRPAIVGSESVGPIAL